MNVVVAVGAITLESLDLALAKSGFPVDRVSSLDKDVVEVMKGRGLPGSLYKKLDSMIDPKKADAFVAIWDGEDKGVWGQIDLALRLEIPAYVLYMHRDYNVGVRYLYEDF